MFILGLLRAVRFFNRAPTSVKNDLGNDFVAVPGPHLWLGLKVSAYDVWEYLLKALLMPEESSDPNFKLG